MPPLRRPIRQARPAAGARQPPARRVGNITFRVLNFKSIAAAELEPRRLTVLAGSNSSGKSSLLQALLFLSQSFGEPTSVINGDLVRLGEPKDVIRDGAGNLTLEVSYPEPPPPDGARVEKLQSTLRITLDERTAEKDLAAAEISFWQNETCRLHADRDVAASNLVRFQGEVVLRLAEPDRLGLPAESYLVVAGVTPSRLVYRVDASQLERSFDQLLAATGHPSSYYLFEELMRSARIHDPSPAPLDLLSDLRQSALSGQVIRLSGAQRDAVFAAYRQLEAPDGWVSEPIATTPSSPWRTWRSVEPHDPGHFTALVRDLGRAVERTERLARSVLYLGPLRDDPRVAYPLGHTVRALPVGEKGEFTAAYLQENHWTYLPYYQPDGTFRRDTLPNAVSTWCEYLQIAERVAVTAQGKLGHQLDIRVSGHDRDPTAIGVGASQLLPVVVLVLGAPEGAFVLLEQPELHLHPKVQSRLADFLAIARPDIRLLVETHSEYLITRLRLRVAEGTVPLEDVAALFASQRVVGGADEETSVHTEFSKLSVNEFGDFNAWPQDFFDSLDADSVALANVVARRLQGQPPSDRS